MGVPTPRAVLPAGGEEGHQPPDRAGHPAGRQDGRQGAQPRRAQQGQLTGIFFTARVAFSFWNEQNTARVLTAAVPIDRVHIPSCDGLVSSLASRCSRDACWHGHDARASMFWFGVEKFL